MGIVESIVALLTAIIPVLIILAILASILRLLNAVEDTAKTLRRIETLLKEQNNTEKEQ